MLCLTTYTINIVVTIGFEQTAYMVGEPSSGVVNLQVCVTVNAGTLGRNLQIVPRWTEGTARGSYNLHMCL